MNALVDQKSASSKTTASKSVPSATIHAECPPLENGDRLTRKEFERRYDAMQNIKKAELIEGVVYVGSPVRIKSHSKPQGMILTWLGAYSAATAGTDFGDNGSVRLDLDNEPQPDAFLRLENGGRSSIDADDYLIGAPELIVEISASSASIDLGAKRNVYRRNGVQEYLVWRVLERSLDWWELVDGEYRSLIPDARNVIESKVFPGLRLNAGELLATNLKAVLDELNSGINSEAHRTFAARIATGNSVANV